MKKNFGAIGTRLLTVWVCLIFTGIFFYLILTLLYPFVIGLLCAYFLQPLIRILEERFAFHVDLLFFFSIIWIFFCIGGIVLFSLIQMHEHIYQFFIQLPQMITNLLQRVQIFTENHLIPFYKSFLSRFDSLDFGTEINFSQTIQNFETTIIDQVEKMIASLLDGSFHFIQHLPSLFTTCMFSLLAAFFIAKDWEKMLLFIHQKLPPSLYKKTLMVFKHLRQSLFGWFQAQLILVFCTGIFVFIGLLLLHVEHAAVLALFIAFVDLLPLFGTGAVFLPWIFIHVLTGELPFAIALLALYIVLIVLRQLLEPKVLSGHLGLQPLPMLASVFVGFQLFGFWGLMLGPALLILLIALKKADIWKDFMLYIQTGKKPY